MPSLLRRLSRSRKSHEPSQSEPARASADAGPSEEPASPTTLQQMEQQLQKEAQSALAEAARQARAESIITTTL